MDYFFYFLPTRQIPLTDRILLGFDYPQNLQYYQHAKHQNWIKQVSDYFITLQQSGSSSSSKSQDINQLNFIKLKAITPKRKAKVIQRLKKEKLDNEKILYFKTYGGPKWKNFLEHVSESDSKALVFLCCKLEFVENIRKVVTLISYTSLMCIRIQSCPITNIEVLQFLIAPNLKCIQISNCSITNVKSLGKTHFKTLRSFKLQWISNQCCVNDFSSISRTCFKQSARKLFDFQIDYFIFRTLNQNRYELNDLRFLMKFQLDTNRTNSMIKSALDFIALRNQMTFLLARQLNNRYQNMGAPERVIRNQWRKRLEDSVIEKHQKWINK